MSTFQLPESFLSSTSYDSPVKQSKPPNELKAPGAPKAQRELAKRKTPDEPNENSSTCSRTLVFPGEQKLF
jgi:hypothetical protein